MELLEFARHRAEALHYSLTEQSCNPNDSYALASAEAKRRSIEVRSYSAGSTQLQGGQALYERSAKVIRHERTKNSFMDAFLIAHELGHDEFESGFTTMPAKNVDPARSADSAGVGGDRVIDYSDKARHEVLMDVFAREFLLPRSLARKWHVEEEMTAADIAKRLGAPHDLVAVQLFDALLLPPLSPTPETTSIAKPLNKKQDAAATHQNGPLLLRAGPGTGKTQTLAGRLSWLRAQGVDPESVLVLTFSNKAAGEMTARASKAWPEAAGALWIGTFHAFGLDLMRRFHSHFGLSPDPKLLDTTQAIALMSDEFARLDLKHFRELWDPTLVLRDLLSAISRAKDEVVDERQYLALSRAMLHEALDPESVQDAERCLEIANVYQAYEELKSKQDVVDFGDLVLRPTVLLEHDEAVRAKLAGRYRHILVDEYQDVNRASVRLLKALCPTGEGLWVVGDTKQSIYRFRGASSTNLQQFATQDFPGATTASLTKNYRSLPGICRTLTEFAQSSMRVAESDFLAEPVRQAKESQPTFISVGTKSDEIGELAARIRAAAVDGVSFKEQAVLCKANDRLGEIANGLESQGVPVLFLGPLFDRIEIKHALSLLSLLVDPRAMGLWSTASMPSFHMTQRDVAASARLLRESGESKEMAWASLLPTHSELSDDDSRKGLAALVDALKGLVASDTPWHAFAKIYLDNTRLAADAWTELRSGNALPAIALWQLQNYLRSTPANTEGYPISALLRTIRLLVVLSDDRELRSLPAAAQSLNAVRLMTIHGSKGLEFPTVHLPSLTNGSLPQSAKQLRGLAPPDGMIQGAPFKGLDALRAGHDEEQECLFFVALSRAENELLLYSPSRQKGGKRQNHSPYIDAIAGSIRKGPAIQEAADGPPNSINEFLTLPLPLILEPAQLAIFEKCPRRFFYTHVLRLGGRRSETAFMQMHTAVQDVVDDLLSGGVRNGDAEEIQQAFEKCWEEQGPTTHGYADSYKSIALNMTNYLVNLRSMEDPKLNELLSYAVGGASLSVKADEHTTSISGQSIYRRVYTGKKTSTATESLDAAAYQLAVGQQGAVEFVFLTSEEQARVDLTPKKLANRKDKIVDAIAEIRSGRFPASPKSPQRSCPSCPHFFHCVAPQSTPS